ncbi:MAG: hypothetical protein IPP01_02720 [Saprospiraceae bacterium]|nr:hypothetical protein [Saprospiraceae bacterium]
MDSYCSGWMGKLFKHQLDHFLPKIGIKNHLVKAFRSDSSTFLTSEIYQWVTPKYQTPVVAFEANEIGA